MRPAWKKPAVGSWQLAVKAAACLLLTAYCLLPTAAAETPAQAVAAAAADVRGLPPELRPRVRYLDLGEIPPVKRENAYRVLSGHVQHLSRESDITRPAIVPGTAGSLLRVNLDDYGWSRKVWEQLADSDPYFHTRLVKVITTTEVWAGGVWSDGKSYPAGSFRWTQKKKQTITALAPWLGDVPTVFYLATVTQSAVPIVRGAWFFNQTAASVDRKPGYYDFLRVKDEKGFQETVGFDAKLATKFGNELRASVADSGVTLQPRAIVRQATLGGGYWRSLDFRLATDGRNPLRILGLDIEKAYDATEQYGHLPNGFWATGLFDKAGKRQDVAPDFIASDGTSRSTDRRVHVNVSCVRCHTNGGLKDVDDWSRNLLQPPLALQSADYRELRKLRQQYLRHLEPFLERDRQVYADAVKEATGWTTKEYAKAYAAEWERFEDAKVDAAWAARDLGVSEKAFVAAIAATVQAGSADPVLSVFLLQGPRRRSLGMRQWLEILPVAFTLMYGVKK